MNIKRFTVAKVIAIAVLILFVLPYAVLRHHAYIRLHDTLEGEWTWLSIIINSGKAFNFTALTTIPQVMNGLLREAFPVGWSFNLLLVNLFGTVPAYVLSSAIIHLIAFGSMRLLLESYYLPASRSSYIVWFAALTFAILPFFIPFGLSVAGQPLVLWAFLNLRKGTKCLYSYLIVALLPFYASIVWFPVPFGMLILVVGLYYFHKKSISWHFAFAWLVMAVGFVIANFSMLDIAFFNHDFVSHREGYDIYMGHAPGWVNAIEQIVLNFFVVHYHVGNFVPVICLIAVLLTVHRSRPLLTAIIIIIACSAIFQGLYGMLEYQFLQYIPFVKNLRFNRLSILVPFLWILVYALALDRMDRNRLLRPLVIPFVLLQLLIALLGNDELMQNYRILTGHQKFPGFDNFMAELQFNAIDKHIGKPKDSYRIASFGMSPTVAQYNGFYTLDGLFAIYDLHYKQQFRKIFAGEIDQSAEIKSYFDGWGNRCYIFSHELGTSYTAYTCYKTQHQSVQHLDFNPSAFRALGGEYLISAVPIANHDQIGLDLDTVFDDSQSWWRIYLYHLHPAQP
jgi:hypothetical protein